MQDLPNAIFTELLGSVHGAYGGAATWGQINGTLANQADLVAAIAAATGGWTTLVQPTELSNSTTTVADITGLGFTPVANAEYEVVGMLWLRTSLISNGPRPSIVWPTGLDDGVGFMQAAGSAQATTPRYGNPAATIEVIITDLPDTTGSWPCKVEASFKTGATPSGQFKLMLRSEAAATAVSSRAGSFLKYRRIA